ncbi:hypothetical protein SGPA1_22100 [Streptomyces misionensis JCM 4497]
MGAKFLHCHIGRLSTVCHSAMQPRQVPSNYGALASRGCERIRTAAGHRPDS